MLIKVSFGILILVVVSVNCEESKSKIFQKNGVTFEVEESKFVVHGAHIPVLPRGSIADIEEMGLLYLTRSNISTIEPGAFGYLPNLENLFIKYNNFQKIEVGVFNDLNLTWLCLSNNGIKYIASHAFDNMTHLQIIDISFNKLKQWNNQWFAKTPSVEFFFLHYNLFTEIPAEAFWKNNKTGDYYISFDGNPLNQIDDDAFKNIGGTIHLDISINNMDVLDGNFLRAAHFDKVDIRIDKIECIDEKYFSRIFIADSTKVTGDPFDKNCANKINAWAAAHQKSVSVQITNYDDYEYK